MHMWVHVCHAVNAACVLLPADIKYFITYYQQAHIPNSFKQKKNREMNNDLISIHTSYFHYSEILFL
jgi:hypothetical protein